MGGAFLEVFVALVVFGGFWVILGRGAGGTWALLGHFGFVVPVALGSLSERRRRSVDAKAL